MLKMYTLTKQILKKANGCVNLYKISTLQKCFIHNKITKSFQQAKPALNTSVLNIPKYEIGVDEKSEYLVLKSGSDNDIFPLVWLRDNCHCENCFNSVANSRTIIIKDFNVNVTPKEMHMIDENNLRIEWSDNHASEYNIEWMRERSFQKENRERYLKTVYQIPKKYWDKSDFKNICHTFDYEQVLKSDEHLHNWLQSLVVYGVSIIENAPLNENEVKNLANRVAYIKRTLYGEEYHVKSKKDTTNVSYLPTILQLHTDMPYYDYNPGVNLLHCIVQAEGPGGENLATDGYFVANLIKKMHLESYDILKNTLVNWFDVGKEEQSIYAIHRAPVICENADGEVNKINFSVHQRDSHFTVDAKYVKKWYQAHRLFVQLIHDYAAEFKTKPGDILTFDNHRLIHGRLPYADTNFRQRHLVGAYLDWDEIYSRLRVLKTKLK